YDVLAPKKLYRKVVFDTLDYIGREMTSPDGAFYSALDADSEGVEGRFYIWTVEEIDRALPDTSERDLAKKLYSIGNSPNFEKKYFIPVFTTPTDETVPGLTEAQLCTGMKTVQVRLLASREQRPRPFKDTKILTAWNGQMIAGYATAAQVFHEPQFT